MTTLFTHHRFRDHNTGQHPESAHRLVSIDKELETGGWLEKCRRGNVANISLEQLATVHSPEQIQAARTLAAKGGGKLDADTVVSPDSFDVALMAAGTATAAVDVVMSGQDKHAVCLMRPPGHHATAATSMGFCLFNNVALAARHAQAKHGAHRVLIVDWDVHHGNGTQDIFYEDPSVYFYSIHRYPFYPGTGDSSETGTGKGLGTTLNVPVSFGTARSEYLELFSRGLEKAIAAAKPDLVIISAGFDAHMDDPVGNLGLASEDFAVLTRKVMDAAKVHGGGRIVSCLEGGYNIDALAESVAVHIATLTQG
ncbi:MAG: histone deacetylase [Deltaproteobacteria bacterium]|nr:histone deacetylase [Deltaproteobacteria bacterium]